MNNILHAPIVLRLNANYMRLGWSSPAQAFCMLMGGEGTPPALAIDVIYEYDEYGMPILEKATFDTVSWETWLTLQPRAGDLDKLIHTSKRCIRIPTVIVCSQYRQMPKKEQRPNARSIRLRDGNRCQYTGEVLTNNTFTLDHIVPRSKGGKDSWENLVACSKKVNSAKGNRSNEEAGLRLLKKPVAPREIPLCNVHTEIRHPDHTHF